MTERDTWEYRAIARTRGNRTLIGTMLIAVLGKSYRLQGKRMGRYADIKANGQVVTPYQSSDGAVYAIMPICTVTDMVQGFRKLADNLKLDDSERRDLFQRLRQWIRRDERVVQNWEGLPIDKHGDPTPRAYQGYSDPPPPLVVAAQEAGEP